MEGILSIIIQYVAEIIGLILISAIGILGTHILNKINQSKKLNNIEAAVIQVTAATQETVRRLQQMLVDNYKETASDGKLTSEQIAELKTKTQLITYGQLGQPIIDLLNAAKLDVTDLITNAAEAYINEIKNNK